MVEKDYFRISLYIFYEIAAYYALKRQWLKGLEAVSYRLVWKWQAYGVSVGIMFKVSV